MNYYSAARGLRTASRIAIAARLRELAATEIDWEYLFLLARRHSIVPLLYLQLDRHAADLVPPEISQPT